MLHWFLFAVVGIQSSELVVVFILFLLAVCYLLLFRKLLFTHVSRSNFFVTSFLKQIIYKNTFQTKSAKSWFLMFFSFFFYLSFFFFKTETINFNLFLYDRCKHFKLYKNAFFSGRYLAENFCGVANSSSPFSLSVCFYCTFSHLFIKIATMMLEDSIVTGL